MNWCELWPALISLAFVCYTIWAIGKLKSEVVYLNTKLPKFMEFAEREHKHYNYADLDLVTRLAGEQRAEITILKAQIETMLASGEKKFPRP